MKEGSTINKKGELVEMKAQAVLRDRYGTDSGAGPGTFKFRGLAGPQKGEMKK